MVDINTVYLKAFKIYRQNFWAFALFTVLPMLIMLPGIHIMDTASQQINTTQLEDPAKLAPEQQMEIAGKFFQAMINASPYLIAGSILSILLSGATVAIARESYESGRQSKIKPGLDTIRMRGLTLIVGITLTAIIAVTGLMFFIIPGLIAYLFLMFVAQAIIIDGAGAIESLRRSINFVRSELFTSFMLLMLQIIFFTASALISEVTTVLIIQTSASLILGVLFAPFIHSAQTVAYCERKKTEELLTF